MQERYTKNYINIYLWRTISLVSGFLSLLIVVPHLSDNPELYGIYSFCISFTLYLTYADIGFLGAGQKYAAEEFTRGNRTKEMEILGFTGAILLIMILPFSFALIYFSFYPDLLISGLSAEGHRIAGDIFLIIGVFTPIQLILQRLMQSILIIRVKDYISLRIDIVFNFIKIISVFYFFSENNYRVVGYYLFITFMTILSSLIIAFIIKKEENYNYFQLIKSIKLSRKYYTLTKKLAFSSMFLTVGWVIYYELDLIIIGKWFGPREVAIYAIGFTFLNFLRTLWNIVFAPYTQRFNHFVASNSIIDMKILTERIIKYTFPLCVIVTFVLVVAGKDLVYLWVGHEYSTAGLILQILVIGTVFGFVSRPASYYFIAKTKYHYLYTLAFVLPIVFIIGIVVFVPNIGIKGFAVSKTVAVSVGFIIALIGISEIVNPFKVMRKWTLQIIVFIIVTVFIQPKLLAYFFPFPQKNETDLLFLMIIIGSYILIAYGAILLTKKQLRDELKSIIYKKYTQIKRMKSL
jgi:O-antigen/teichoic acid export membrane protein